MLRIKIGKEKEMHGTWNKLLVTTYIIVPLNSYINVPNIGEILFDNFGGQHKLSYG
jgi:hypothetical protein